MNQSRITCWPPTIGRVSINSGARTATSLNAAYVHGTSGPAVAIRFVAQTTDPIDELYIFLDTNGGTLGSITMESQIYNENTASRAGTTSRDTSTATTMPGAVDKWIKFAFGTPYTPAIGEILWLVAYNTSASPTVDFPGILTSTTAFNVTPADVGYSAGYVTTNGFSGSATASVEIPYVVKCGSNYFGNPFTQFNSSYYTNNTRQRGIVVTPTEDITYNGCYFNNATTAFNELIVYADATAPGGSAIATHDLDSNANATTSDACGASTWAAETLTGGSTYKAIMTFSSNSQLPSVWQIEDYASYSSIFDSLRANDTLGVPWGAIDDGAGGWTIDKAICPALALYVDDNPAQAGGGGLLTHPGMRGGMNG